MLLELSPAPPSCRNTEQAKAHQCKCCGLWHLGATASAPCTRDPDTLGSVVHAIARQMKGGDIASVTCGRWRGHRHGIKGISRNSRAGQCVYGSIALTKFSRVIGVE